MRKREINAVCDRIEKHIDSVFGNDSIFALNAQKEEQKETHEQIHAGTMISIPENLKKDNQEKKVSDAEISEKKKEKAIIMDYFYQKAKKGKDELMKMTGKQIYIIANEIGCKKTGKKAVVVKAILSKVDELEKDGYHISDILTKKGLSVYPTIHGFVVSGNDSDLLSYDEGIAFIDKYVFDSDIHEVLSRSIVKNVAMKEKGFNGKDSCLQIVNSYYQEEIFNDIIQEVSYTIASLIRNGLIQIEDNKVIFMKNSFGKLYKAMFSVLESYKTNKETTKGLSVICSNDSGTKNESGETIFTETIVDANVTTLASICNIDDLVNNETVVSFIRFMKRTDAKHFDKCFKVFSGRLQGFTFKEIAIRYGFSETTAKNYFAIVKMLYSDFMDGKPDIVAYPSNNDSIGCTYRKSDNSASGSYTFSYNNGIYGKTSFNEISQEVFEEYLSKNRYFFNVMDSGINNVVIPAKTDLADRFEEKSFTKPVLTGKDGLLPEYIRNSRFSSENIRRRNNK